MLERHFEAILAEKNVEIEGLRASNRIWEKHYLELVKERSVITVPASSEVRKFGVTLTEVKE